MERERQGEGVGAAIRPSGMSSCYYFDWKALSIIPSVHKYLFFPLVFYSLHLLILVTVDGTYTFLSSATYTVTVAYDYSSHF